MFYSPGKYKFSVFKVIILIIFTSLFGSKAYSQELDYRAQSLYIYKFSKYIFWPEDKLKGDFKIGVYGNSPIFEELKLMASLKKAANGLNITVKEISEGEDLSAYHIIYVPASKSRQINALTEQIENAPVLIVAEREGMATRGATISFLITENLVLKFEINMARLEEQKLKIAEELLSLGFKI